MLRLKNDPVYDKNMFVSWPVQHPELLLITCRRCLTWPCWNMKGLRSRGNHLDGDLCCENHSVLMLLSQMCKLAMSWVLVHVLTYVYYILNYAQKTCQEASLHSGVLLVGFGPEKSPATNTPNNLFSII